MNVKIFRSKGKGSFFGMNHLRRNLAGAWYWQFWMGKTHLTIGNATRG
jgi:hypothetical protein